MVTASNFVSISLIAWYCAVCHSSTLARLAVWKTGAGDDAGAVELYALAVFRSMWKSLP